MNIKNSNRKRDHQAAFAAANGWRFTDSSFTLAALRAGKGRGRYWLADSYGPLSVLDHGEYYLDANKRPVAIVGHPYWSTKGALCRPADQEPEVIAWAEQLGLLLRQCPDRNASWHYPGWTALVVLTRPETNVVWIPPCPINEPVPAQVSP